ncbi:MAG: HDOD domain-containing protein, partial [Gammaproteobacteria bacterium]|nr:HDOD domain-containing protein [Gammaproteobacteria bacterium]
MTDTPPDRTSPHARVQDILLLPPLPVVACKLLGLVGREDCDIEALASLIEQDPGLTARIVGIANSAYFARRTPICSVSEAIVRVLGLNLVRGIAIGIALSKPFDADACPSFQLDRYWYRAVQAAHLAGALAPLARLGDTERDCLFLCGLLHNLGQIVLVHAFPDRMNRVFQLWAEQPAQGLLSLQMRHIAMTEIEAGSLIAQRWQLPAHVADAIEFRHDPLRAGGATPMVQLIAYCAEYASALYDDPAAPLPSLGSIGSALTA